jgi:hypothetical protein
MAFQLNKKDRELLFDNFSVYDYHQREKKLPKSRIIKRHFPPHYERESEGKTVQDFDLEFDKLEERINSSTRVCDVFSRKFYSIQRIENNPFHLIGIARKKFEIPLFGELDLLGEGLNIFNPNSFTFRCSLFIGQDILQGFYPYNSDSLSLEEKKLSALKYLVQRAYSCRKSLASFTDEIPPRFYRITDLNLERPTFNPNDLDGEIDSRFNCNNYVQRERELLDWRKINTKRIEAVANYMTEMYEASLTQSNPQK